jgi:hypothetical protein
MASSTTTPGFYSTKMPHKNVLTGGTGYISVGDPYKGAKNDSPARYKGKQMMVGPLPSIPFSYASDMYQDKSGYVKTQPLDQRKLGFGSHNASCRDEFTTTIRTEQYREQLKTEKNVKPMPPKSRKPLPNQSPRAKIKLIPESPGSPTGAADFPSGLTPCKHLYDIGRNLETNFDPRSPTDTFYNALQCKSRARGNRRTGGYWLSSQDVGEGTVGLDHATCKPEFGNVRTTKQFADRSHLGQSPLC